MSTNTSGRADLVSVLVLGVFGVFSFFIGLYALLDTSSFHEDVARFEPYNRHLYHDIGAFVLGLGVVALLAIVWRNDALLAALGGAAAGSAGHFISHVVDEDLGGRAADPWTFGVIAVITGAVFVWRLWARYAGSGSMTR